MRSSHPAALGEGIMPTDVIMPQMGESIVEGTLTKWLKKPGDKVQRDEPLFEISTDKVDAEIPAPASGVLKEIKIAEGATVQVNTVVGVIDAEGAAAAAPAPPKPEAPKAAAPVPPAPSAPARQPQPAAAAPRKGDGARPQPPPTPEPARPREAVARQAESVIEFPSVEEGERVRSSPLVRRIARDNNVDLSQVAATGMGGRITKEDILRFIEQHPAGSPPAAAAVGGRPAPAAAPQPVPTMPAALPGDLVPMSTMRKKIAEHMVASKRTSAHVHSVFEVDMTRVVKLRDRERADWKSATAPS